RQACELQPVELDVLPGGELAVAAPEPVRDLADRAELPGAEQPPGQLDPEHERPDLRLVVVEAPPLQPNQILLGHALVPGGDQSRELVEHPERALLALEALDGVPLEDELPTWLCNRHGWATLPKVVQKVK